MIPTLSNESHSSNQTVINVINNDKYLSNLQKVWSNVEIRHKNMDLKEFDNDQRLVTVHQMLSQQIACLTLSIKSCLQIQYKMLYYN